jgi:hypothetical protein
MTNGFRQFEARLEDAERRQWQRDYFALKLYMGLIARSKIRYERDVEAARAELQHAIRGGTGLPRKTERVSK